MSKQEFQDHHFEGLPPGLIFFLGEMNNKVDHIGATLNQMRQNDKDMEQRLRETIFKETEQLKIEKDREIEIIHKRIESSRNRSIAWFTGIATLIGGLGVLASLVWK